MEHLFVLILPTIIQTLKVLSLVTGPRPAFHRLQMGSLGMRLESTCFGVYLAVITNGEGVK